jgi:formate dehydrogenase subunit gamma
MRGERRVPRFDVYERTVHWLAALSFLYAALTGLALWSHKLYWLAWVFGGGVTVRGLHPWGGAIFTVVLGLMFRRWAAQMRLDAEDREWLKRSPQYVRNQEEGMPESGRFNAGQKMLFWTQSAVTLLLFASGSVLWWPELMPRALRLAAVLIHPLAAIVALGGIIIHIYMGTAAVPGSLRGMVRGWVSPGWAASHHAKWYRQSKER